MKIRTDFVTNSSSSSFILARRGELTDRQKDVIVKFVEEEFLGKVILTPDSTDEKIEETFEQEYINARYHNRIKRILKDGKTIYGGSVCFECCSYSLADLYTSLWEKLEEIEDDTFETIDGRLSY